MDTNQVIADRITHQLGIYQFQVIQLGAQVDTLSAQNAQLQAQLKDAQDKLSAQQAPTAVADGEQAAAPVQG